MRSVSDVKFPMRFDRKLRMHIRVEFYVEKKKNKIFYIAQHRLALESNLSD